MKSNNQIVYSEKVGEKYQLKILAEGKAKDHRLKEVKHSINLLNNMLNRVPVRKKRVLLKAFPLPGEFGKHIQAFLEQFKIESRPTGNTMRMYLAALSHFAVRMQLDRTHPDNLYNFALSRLYLLCRIPSCGFVHLYAVFCVISSKCT